MNTFPSELAFGIVLVVLICMLLLAARVGRRRMRSAGHSRRLQSHSAITWPRARAKPEWVRREVMHLASHLRGCRTIAAVFNRCWVAEFVRENAREIEALRRERKARPARSIAARSSWALDLSYVRSSEGTLLTVLGILDAGSRKVLALRSLPSKSAFIVLGHLLVAIGRFGLPANLRTDNEGMFTGALWQCTLRALAIVHRRGPPAQPWRNGRVERFSPR